MRLKTYAAIVTGALAMLVTTLILWVGTQLPIEDVIVISLVAYVAGLIGAHAVIDKLERRRRKNLTATIITLIRDEQGRGKEAQDVDGRGDQEGAVRA